MADTGNILSATLQVKDSFTSQLNKFSQALNKAESAFSKFVTKIDQSSTKIEKTLDRINKKMDSTTNKIISQTNRVADSIDKSTNKVQQSQQKALDNLLNKYTKMGGDIQEIFQNVQKEAEQLNKTNLNVNINNNGGNGGGSNNHNHGSSGMGSMQAGFALASLAQGDVGMALMALGSGGTVVGATLMATNKILTSIEDWIQQGYNALNTLSTGLLSVDGLKEGVEEAGQFEQNRISMDMLYGNNKELGYDYYKKGVTTAKNTTYGERETGELQKKLAGANISYSQDQLNLLADIASLRPNTPLEHVGFSIVDAMYGRTTSLKTMYMLDNKEVQAYLKKLQTSKDANDKKNGQKWKDSFNSKGTVNNKQEYFELLMDFVEKETNYKGLNGELMKTMLGKVDRLQGNWETLKADLLGIDANDTGLVKTGKVTVISSIEDALDDLAKWLDDSGTKKMLSDLGEGLGTAVHSVTDALKYALEKVDWKLVGETFKRIGKEVEDFVKQINQDGTLDNFLKALPDLVKLTLNDTMLKTAYNTSAKAQLASGHPVDAYFTWWQGIVNRGANGLGISPEDMNKPIPNTQFGQYWGNILNGFNANSSYGYLSKANAYTVLANDPNLSDDDRKTVKDMIDQSNQNIFNVTIAEVKSDNVEEFINALKQHANNSK